MPVCSGESLCRHGKAAAVWTPRSDTCCPPAAAALQGKRVAVSGSGNVAVYTVEKLLELGAVPLTMSDSTGYVYYAEGMTEADLDAVNTHKVLQRGRLSDFKGGAGPLFWCPALCEPPGAADEHAMLCWFLTLGCDIPLRPCQPALVHCG